MRNQIWGWVAVFILALSQSAQAMYDPLVGRWTTRDPLPDAELIEGPNLYAYVGNNPINYVDPFGLFSVIASEFGGVGDANRNAYGPFNQSNNFQGPWVNSNLPGVALPARLPADLRMVKITNPANGLSVIAPVVDIGPHNINDPYWSSASSSCSNGGGLPLAESQYANKEKDQLGRVPTNPAGIDMTPATMNALRVPGKSGTRQAPVDWDFVK